LLRLVWCFAVLGFSELSRSRSLSAGTKSEYAWRWARGTATRFISCCARELDLSLQASRSVWQAPRPQPGSCRAWFTASVPRRRAPLDLGGIERCKEECRDTRRLNWIQDLIQDLRFGLRMLRKTPGFTAVAVITLALGISANTTIFSTVNAFFLRKPPIRDPDRVVIVSSVSPEKNTYAPDRIPVSAPDYLDWRAQDKSFDVMAAPDFEDFTISGGTAPD